ncbi:MAG TPA: methylated-DNA--[protein]-cysteine S-methyltransferase [Porticoccaceae bacterium]|nr:methylated-DNA--[protein]-cysteine S-methyltransferase [Porticoccaceae bacterium]
MHKISIQYFKHSYAEFILGSYDNKLCLCDFRYRKLRSAVDDRIQKLLRAVFVEKPSEVIETTKVQLNEYFSGARTSFDLPLITAGTPFQKSVWDALQTISYGETQSYQDLATTIDNVGAVRAVGTANGANALAIIIPCHRVIASDGNMGGYGGGLPLKKRLLELEEKVLAY